VLHCVATKIHIGTAITVLRLDPPSDRRTNGILSSQFTLEYRTAAMQHCCMATTIPLSKRGTLTLPPALRRKLGFDKLSNPMVLVEECEGGLFLQPAVAMPMRDIPKATIDRWIARDEADMATFRATPRKVKR
jgi:hypothetical protein